jgi:hypothetical protein
MLDVPSAPPAIWNIPAVDNSIGNVEIEQLHV